MSRVSSKYLDISISQLGSGLSNLGVNQFQDIFDDRLEDVLQDVAGDASQCCARKWATTNLFLHVPSHLPAVATEAFGLIVPEIGSGKADVFDAASITVVRSLDVLVELIESFGPANGLLEVVELVFANQFPHSLLKKLVEQERASHATFSRDELRQLKAGLSHLDLVSDEVNSTTTGIAKDESIASLNVTLIHKYNLGAQSLTSISCS